jgi:sialate O-acetylesterase
MRKILLCFIIFPFLCHAKVTLPSILGDNMVLQQQSDVKLWGKAMAGKKITVSPSWTNKQFQTVVNPDGRWLISISTPKAGGPYEIKINDGDEIILKNILIGEVWFCSGQSNMEMPMRGFEFEPVDGANDIIAMSNESTLIRMYSSDFDNKGWFRQYSKIPLEDCKGQWLVNTSENVARTSATAYYFAKYLHETLDVPVGIVVSSWGGSNIESWMSEEIIKPFEVNLSHLYDDQEIQEPIQQRPCVLFNAKVAPLTNFTIKGFLWHQGESNRHNIEQYEKMLPVMVSDYRNRWGYDFPFYYVELAPYSYGDADGITTGYFREMQLRLMAAIPNSGMACTADIGSHDFIHPKNKADVGKRLAYWALANDYGRKQIGHRTPTYKSMEVKEGKAYITFENAPGKIHPINTPLKSFEIAGTDRIFHPAKAMVNLTTKQLLVWRDDIPEPVAVRYAFRDYAEASIFDYYGLPVAPFRTDNW